MSERARYLAIGCGSCEYEEADGSLVHYCAKCSSEIYQFLTQAALADRLEQEELSYARQLAIGMHAHHYADVTEWRPLPDLIGLLTQISNMAAGLALRPEPAQPVAQDSVPMWPIARVLSRDGKIVEAEYYSPSLPDDVWHDLYPTSPSHPALSAAGAELCRECLAVSASIGSHRFMDPPDGGDVSLAEQVRRMRVALENAESILQALLYARDKGEGPAPHAGREQSAGRGNKDNRRPASKGRCIVVNAEQVRTRLLAAAQRYGSQKALAEAIGVSAPFICDIINGRRKPSGKPVKFLGLKRKVSYVKRTANGNE